MYKVRVEFCIRSNEEEELTIPFAIAYRETICRLRLLSGYASNLGYGGRICPPCKLSGMTKNSLSGVDWRTSYPATV